MTMVFADPPTSPYTANETLDPSCGPTATNCYVNPGASWGSITGTLASQTDLETALNARVVSAGVTGGQSITGGTGTTDALSFIGTSGNGTATSPALNFDVGNNGGTNALTVLNNGAVGVGVTNPSGALTVGGNRSATAWGTNGIGLQIKAATYTDTSSSGTAADLAVNSMGIDPITASHTTIYTEASTLYIAGPPAASTNVSITNPWALNVATGNSQLGTKVQIGGANLEKMSLIYNAISFNRDAATGAIFNSNGYAYTWSHSASIVNSSDKLALALYNPSGIQVSTPLTINGQGYIGIDGAALNQAFNVDGNIQIQGTGNGIYFPDGSFMSTNAGGAGIGTTSTTDLDFAADSDDNGSGVMNFTVHGIGAMNIANDGYVGIGTTSPTQPLTVNGNIQVAGTGNGIYFPDGSFMGSAANIGTGISAPGNVALLADSTNTDSSAGITLATAGTTYFDMVNNGDIGIGTTIPSTTLQISSTPGNGVMIGTGTYPTYLGTNGLLVQGAARINSEILSSGYSLSWGASQAYIVGTNPATGSASYLSFYTGGLSGVGERMRIADDGDVGIGTITPSYLLDVGSSAITSGTVVAQFQNAGGTCEITPDLPGGVTCSSDMRLKKNIVNLSDDSTWSFNSNIAPANQTVLAKVLALNPVDYNWNVEANGTPQHAGFIAQEVQQVFPDLVQTNASTGYLTLDYTGLVPYTIEAIKEMNVNITNIDDLTTPNTWRDALENWFADVNNGISSFAANELHAKNEICINQTCITETQLQQILQNDGETNTGSSSGTTDSGSADNPNAPDSTTVVGDPNADGTQSSDVIAPAVNADTQSADVTDPVVSSS